MMIAAFLVGGGWQYWRDPQQSFPGRKSIYQVIVFYLLFKIGFSGGASLELSNLNQTLFGLFVAIVIAVIWTLITLAILKRWSGLPKITQASIAAHFGSVSVGTFAAALAFLSALGYTPDQSVVLWLALMELPAIFVGIMVLKIPLKHLWHSLKKEVSLITLVLAIFVGIIFKDIVPSDFKVWFLEILFLPAIFYFLYEMGRKAAENLTHAAVNLKSLAVFGVGIALLGGWFGISAGFLLGYDLAEAFILAILLASASYVLVPICMEEILNKAYPKNLKAVKAAISTSMTLSVGIVLPFNIILGFELYHLYYLLLEQIPSLAWLGLILPLSLLGLGFIKKA